MVIVSRLAGDEASQLQVSLRQRQTRHASDLAKADPALQDTSVGRRRLHLPTLTLRHLRSPLYRHGFRYRAIWLEDPRHRKHHHRDLDFLPLHQSPHSLHQPMASRQVVVRASGRQYRWRMLHLQSLGESFAGHRGERAEEEEVDERTRSDGDEDGYVQESENSLPGSDCPLIGASLLHATIVGS